MNRNNPELLIVLNRLKEHKQKKEKFIEQDGADALAVSNAEGRITALTHAITEIEHLYQTGEVKSDSQV